MIISFTQRKTELEMDDATSLIQFSRNTPVSVRLSDNTYLSNTDIPHPNYRYILTWQDKNRTSVAKTDLEYDEETELYYGKIGKAATIFSGLTYVALAAIDTDSGITLTTHSAEVYILRSVDPESAFIEDPATLADVVAAAVDSWLQANGIPTDSTLSVAGKPADAAATGAAITALKETITVPVSRISGLVSISPNLIDIDSCTVGKNINTSGEIVDNESTMITDYIEVPLGTDCWITKNCNPNGTNGIYACALYSEDKNFITRLYNSTTLSSFGIAAGNNCKYVRLAMYTAATDMMAVLDIQSDQPTYTDLPYSEFGKKWIEYDYLSKWLDDIPTGDAITQIITDYPNSGDHPLDHIIRDGGMCGIFRTIGVVGDSLSSGLLEYKNSEGETQGVDCYEHSWIKHIGRICGSTAHNFSVGGLKASTFWTTTNAKVKLLRDADENYKCDAYFIALGVNDIADENIEVGSSADIANDESTTFYGYYSRIIKLIQTIQPRAKIFLVGLPNDSKMTAWGSRFTNFKNAVADMVNYFDNCYYLDLYTYEKPYNSDFHEIYFNGFHENVLGYLRTAWIISSYVDWIVRNHYTEFREAGFIGTDYHYYNS